MTIQRMCELGQISRCGWYRYQPDEEQPQGDLDLRDIIQRVALEFPCYGRPRITAELKRRGWPVNHKRMGRIMREDNLLCLRRRKFVPTTDSNHNYQIYPNLAAKMTLTGVDQLWVADITYIRLESEIRLPGRGVGRILAAGDWLGVGPYARGRLGDRGAANGVSASRSHPRVDASFRPGCAVRLQGNTRNC